ncbi:MAG: serine hydrolase [Bacteroidales bacterium]|nr:serine hydrolase [Bacteroidales bacterium]
MSLKNYLYLFIIIILVSCHKEDIQNDYIGFNTADFNSHNFREDIFFHLDSLIKVGKFGNIDGIIIIHDNEMIKEQYYHGWDRNDLHEMQSATKSITSLLIGHAVTNDTLSVDDNMVSFFSDYNILNNDSQKSEITVQHMLTMSTGLEWDEWTIPYGNEGNSLTDMYNSTNDYVSYILNKPVAEPPGTKFTYNSGISFLLGAILQIVSNEKVEEYATSVLYDLLEINKINWLTHNGLAHCGGGLNLRPVDMAKIGSLILNNGKWNGVQYISEEWVLESVKSRHNVNDIWDYGYQWWLFKPPFKMQNIIQARGYGWQSINIIPELDMVVVVTGQNKTNETVLLELDLLLDIMSCSPKFYSIITDVYNYQMNHPGTKTLSDREINTAGHFLIQYREYQKASDYLLQFINDESLGNNLFYNFNLGEALFKIENFPLAKIYLEKHISLNLNTSLFEKDYYQKANKMLEIINNL